MCEITVVHEGPDNSSKGQREQDPELPKLKKEQMERTLSRKYKSSTT